VRKRSLARHLGGRLQEIAGVRPPTVGPGRDHVYMLYTTIVENGDRDLVLKALNAQGIEARLYFPPAHHQPVFGGDQPELPVTDWAADHALSLPLHTRLTLEDLDEIAGAVADALT
jgi:perosamine synthetase